MKRILIVDDEKVFRDQLELALSRDGHKVVVAENAQQAIDIGVHFRPDILISDWMLQDELHGLHVIDVLSSVYPAMHAIIITGFASSDLKEKAKQQGVFAFLEKPFDIAELKEVVSQASVAEARVEGSAAVAVMEVDENDRIVFANGRAMALFSDLGIDIVASQRNLSDFLNAESLSKLQGSSTSWLEVEIEVEGRPSLWFHSRQLSSEDTPSRLFVVLHQDDKMLQRYSVVRMLLGMPRTSDRDRELSLHVEGNVLVVDDYEILRTMTCEILENSGCICHSAESHEAAIRIARNDPNIRLVILDYEMPEGTAETVIEVIRRERSGAIIVGTSGANCRENFEKAGVGLFLPKPWIADDLKNVLNGIM